MLFPWGENVSSTTSFVRQPKLVTSARGQTCVQLGVEADTNNFGSSAFARRYLRNRADILFRAISCETVRNKKSAVHFSLFLWVLRCFTSPGSFHTTYVFSRGYPDFIGMGFPIRTFPDQR